MEKRRTWLTPSQIAERLGVSATTVRTWIHAGVKLAGSEARVKLKAIDSGRYLVRKKWLAEFLAALEAADDGRPVPPRPEPPGKQQARMQAEKEALAARLRKIKRNQK